MANLAAIDKELLEEVCVFLKPFDRAIAELSEEEKPTMHKVIPIRQLLLNHCDLKYADSDELKELKFFVVPLIPKPALTPTSELDNYMSLEIQFREDDDVLFFWKENTELFPMLSSMIVFKNMNLSSNPLIIVSVLLVLVLNLAFTDAAGLINDDSMTKSTESDEILLNKQDVEKAAAHKFISRPSRRQHLRFGVLGKRYSYGYLGRRSDEAQTDSNLADWLYEVRERRAGRPQYGILG
ncbi:unnamed protein product [Rotaria socialis]|uniref:Uncharacterized protein n=2 Tax=Rotaria socialis TaxID=392032 RepID=A0A817JXF4_9BILA|nr:unnamed protein product [Rotaria socialis]